MNVGKEKYPILLSVVMVVDCWAEQASEAVRLIADGVGDLVTDYEIILVDNGSGGSADSFYRLLTAADGHPNVQVYQLLHRVDYEVAAWAGVENSLGDLILVIEPFSENLQPLGQALDAAINNGIDLVLMVNETPRHEMIIKAALRRAYSALFRWLGGVNLRVEAAQYRLMSKRIVSYLLQQPSPASRYRTLPATAGFPKAIMRYSAPRRPVPGASFWVDARRAARLLLSNSTAPARIASIISLTGAGLNVVYSVYVVVLAFTRSDLQPGWTTLSLQQSGMFFLFSLLAFVLTEYLIDNIRGGRTGTSYFVINELSSVVLTRRQRLNIESHDIKFGPENRTTEASGGVRE